MRLVQMFISCRINYQLDGCQYIPHEYFVNSWQCDYFEVAVLPVTRSTYTLGMS